MSRNRVQNNTEEEDKKKFNFLKHATRFMLAIQNISINYSENQGTFLPGYLNQSKTLGQDWAYLSPGLPFAFGSQIDIRQKAGDRGWITKSESLNTMYKTNLSQNLTLRSTLQPIKQFRIELTANKTTSQSNSEYYRWVDDLNSYNSFSPTESGSFSISFISWRTAFNRDNDNNESEVFNRFRDYRLIIAEKLAQNNPNFKDNTVDESISWHPITDYPIEIDDDYEILINIKEWPDDEDSTDFEDVQ